MNITDRVCPACGSQGLIQRGGQHWKFWDTTYTLASCPACGSITTDPTPSDATLERLYREGFNYHWYRDHYDAKLKDARQRVAEYSDRLGPRVLDFGGGLGYFSQAVRETGRESVTYDPFAGGDPIEGEWDSIVALHVLEHSNNVGNLLHKIIRHLKPGGNLLLAVPNLDGAGYRKLDMNWVWAQPPLVHVHHFTALGLCKLLTRNGFSECAIRYRERWDANRVADIEEVKKFSQLDNQWGKFPFVAIPMLRQYIARRNATARFRALTQSTIIDGRESEAAELEISARFLPSSL